MKAHGLARLGRDAELRQLTSGDTVASLSLAFSWGKKDQDGKKPTQWVEASFWGKRAETLAPYLVKGSLVVVYLDDVRIETFEGRNGPGHKLSARVNDIELLPRSNQGAQQLQARPQARSSHQDIATQGSGFDDMDDDLPF